MTALNVLKVVLTLIFAVWLLIVSAAYTNRDDDDWPSGAAA